MLNSAFGPSGQSGQSLSQFLWHEATGSIKFAGTHLYAWVERGTVRVKCLLAQEHHTMSPARARTRSTRSGVERANHEATAPPTINSKVKSESQMDHGDDGGLWVQIPSGTLIFFSESMFLLEYT